MYEVLNEITGAIIKTFDQLDEAIDFASKEWLNKKKQPLLIKESSTDNIVRQFGLLLD